MDLCKGTGHMTCKSLYSADSDKPADRNPIFPPHDETFMHAIYN